MNDAEIVALSKKHTLFEWTAQGAIDPIPIARARGVYFWTSDDKRFLDFNSQLMCVHIGHGDARVVRAIQEQAAMLPYVAPSTTTEVRARLGAKLAEITPGDIDASDRLARHGVGLPRSPTPPRTTRVVGTPVRGASRLDRGRPD